VSRMVSVCKEVGAALLVSESVRGGVAGTPGLTTRPLGEVGLKGKSAPISLHAVESVAVV